MRRAASIALLFSLGAAAQARFLWEVPGEIARVPVPGTQIANGVPVRLQAVRSKWKPEALIAHFRRSFASGGLYLPPSGDVRLPTTDPALTGFDPRTQVTYTVILKASSDGTTTCLLGEAHPAEQAAMAEPSFPLFPAAKSIVRTVMEGVHVVGYSAAGAPAEVQRFYREVLGRKGYVEEPKGTFTRGAQVLTVRVGRARLGKVPVTVLAQEALEGSGPPYVAPGEARK